MRQIKFRLIKNGKIVGYERWSSLVGKGWKSLVGKWCYDSKPNGSFDIRNDFIPHTDKEMSTGLLDENGKDLDWWEGDILKHKNTIYSIVWHNGGLYAMERDLHTVYPIGELITWVELPIKIGSIYDNPDLMEKK